jgi:hypothetical protein
MKTKYPPVFSVSDYMKLYMNPKEVVLNSGYIPKNETQEMVKIRLIILEILNGKNIKLLHFEILTVYYKQLFILNNIEYFKKIIYQLDIKSKNNKTYKIATIIWPQIEGKDISVRVSLGVNDEVKNKINPLKDKMKEELKICQFLKQKKMIDPSLIQEILNINKLSTFKFFQQ